MVLFLSFKHSYALSQCVYFPVEPGVSTATFHPRATQRYTDLSASDGRVMVARSYRAITMVLPAWGWKFDIRPPSRITMNQNAAFDWTRQKQPGASYIRLVMPLWELAAIFALVPSVWFLFRPRRAPGLCVACGYDMRATPDRCPECGLATARPVPPQ